MKVIIAGSRYGVYQHFFEDKLKELFLNEDSPYTITQVVSGCAQGVDTMAINWATQNNIPIVKFHANWEQLGRSAGPMRNAEMAKYGDILIAFFNENAKNEGTKNMCKQMADKGKKVIRFHEKLCRVRVSLPSLI